MLREDVLFLEEARLDVFRRRHDARAGERREHVTVQVGRQRVDHRREQHVDLVMLGAREQLAVVAVDALHRVAAIDRAASLAELARLILRAVGGELDLARVDAERVEESDPELVRRPEIENARDADAQARRAASPPVQETTLGAAEGGFANHFSSVGVGIPGALHIFLHDPHLVGVFQQSLRTGVAADHALPAGAERHLAPRAALAFRQAHIDERALAAHRAPGARRVLIRRARVLERLDHVVAAKARRRACLQREVSGAQRRADRARLAGIGMHHDLGVGHFRR